MTGLENFTLKILNMSQVRKDYSVLSSFSAHCFYDLILCHLSHASHNLHHIVSGVAFSGCIGENSLDFVIYVRKEEI